MRSPVDALGGLLLLVALTPLALAGEGEANAIERPKTNVLRWKEDWSVLAEVDRRTTGDWWDRIKYLPLSTDGESWASFGGHAGARVEGWQNFGFGPANDDVFLLGRIWLHADLHARSWLRFFVEGKSAHATDRELPGGKRALDVDQLDLQQGFVEITVPFCAEGSKFTLRAGRQQFLFGAQRLVSPLPWSNTMRAWDGVSAAVEVSGWNIHGFWSQFVPVKKYEFNAADSKTRFWGLYAAGTIEAVEGSGLDAYLLGLHRGRDVTFNGTTGSEDRYTAGLRFHGDVPGISLDYDAEAAYQFGRVGSGDVRALMVALEAGYRLTGTWAEPRLFLGFDYASGDRSAGGDVETFNQLFPLGHKYLGYIDVIGRQNIVALTLGTALTPLERGTLRLAVHSFWRATSEDALYDAGGGNVRSGAAGTSGHVGVEVDLTFRYRFDLHFWGEFGYCHFFPGEFIGETGTDSAIDFLYLWFVYTF